MIVKCLYNIPSLVVDIFDGDSMLKDRFNPLGDKIALEIGKHYYVFALFNIDGVKLLYVSDENFKSLGYPVPYPIQFFEIIDSAPSKGWQVSFDKVQEGKWASPEFWSSEVFYEELVGQDPRRINQFKSFLNCIA